MVSIIKNCENTIHNSEKSCSKKIENEINIQILKNKIKKLCNHNDCIKINNYYYPFPVYECRKCSSNFGIHQKQIYEFSNIGFFTY